MRFTTRNKAIALLAACAAGAATAAAAQSAGSSPSSPAGTQPPESTQLARWTLRTDPSDRGVSLGWQRGGFSGATVSVPNDVYPTSYKGPAGARNFDGSVAWYRTTVQAPQPGTYALMFQSANYQATVWMDGHALGSHHGFYLPFEFHAHLAAGTHTLVVRIDWRDPTRQEDEGFHRTWFNWGGLNGGVEVRRLGESELSHPTIETTLSPNAPDAAQATVTIGVEVHNGGAERALTAEGTLVHGSQSVPVSFPSLTLAHGQTERTTASVTVPRPALWSPSSPNLYRLTLRVPGESSYTANVGLRLLTWREGRAYLNGRRLELHGATIQQDAQGHGDALTASDEQKIVDELHAIAANAVRAQHPLPPSLLEKLDAAGILVWQGIGPVEGAGNWYSNTPKLLAEAEQQARTAALNDELHPSIIAWNLVDEVAGDNGHDEDEVRYVLSVGRWLHSHDPGRMVAIDVWGDHPPTLPGPMYSVADAIAETDYTGWYDSPNASAAQMRVQMQQRLAAMQRTFPGKVLVISEFGAESNTLNPAGTPGSYSYQSNLLATHIAAYEADPQLSGMLIWLLRDYPLNPAFYGGSITYKLPHLRLIEGLIQKGLFTYGGSPKPAVSVVARLFGALPKD